MAHGGPRPRQERLMLIEPHLLIADPVQIKHRD